MTALSIPIANGYDQKKFDKCNNTMHFATLPSHSPPVNPLVPQWPEYSVPECMEPISGYYRSDGTETSNALFQSHSNMQKLSDPIPSIEGSIDWFANGNHDSAVKCSTTQPGTHPVSPSLLEDHGCDFQVYHPGFEPSTDLKAFLSSSFSTQDSRFLNTPNDPQAPHTIQRLPSSEVRHVDSFLERQNISGKHKWTCHYPSCEGSASWRNKDAARSHVYKHLNETKLFKCVQCNVSFASEKNAIRHRTYQGRSFPCSNCSSVYTRIDYRNKHQKLCSSKL